MYASFPIYPALVSRTDCPPNSGDEQVTDRFQVALIDRGTAEDSAGMRMESGLGERCCLKRDVPTEGLPFYLFPPPSLSLSSFVQSSNADRSFRMRRRSFRMLTVPTEC